MAKLSQLSGRELLQKLRKFGFEVDRVTGSHHVVRHETDSRSASVPCHGNKPLKKGTLKGILNQLGISVDDLLDA